MAKLKGKYMNKAEKELFLEIKDTVRNIILDLHAYTDYSQDNNIKKLNNLIDKLIDVWHEPKEFAITPSDLLKTIENLVKIELEGGLWNFTEKLIDKLIELLQLLPVELLGRLMHRTEYEYCKRGLNK